MITMKLIARLALPLVVLISSCSTLGGGDITTMRNVARGRYDKVTAVSLVLDKLIAQPAPKSLSPAEKQAWNDQTAWMLRTKTNLLSFSLGLKRVIDSPHPSGTSFDDALVAAQLASDYAKLSDDLASLMSTITVEKKEDERRIAAAEGTKYRSAQDTTADTTMKSGLALSTPLKTRHDSAGGAISTIA